MKNFCLITLFICFSGLPVWGGGTSEKAVYDLIERVTPGYASQYRLEMIQPENGSDVYEGFDISKDASDAEKRNKIAEKYIKSAQLEGSTEEIANQLDEIIEDALSDYSPKSNNVKEILSNSTTLGKAEGKRLDAIIKYAGIDIDKNASDTEKRNKIADFYIKSAQLEGSNEEIANQLDEIVEDALSDYVSNNKNPFDTK